MCFISLIHLSILLLSLSVILSKAASVARNQLLNESCYSLLVAVSACKLTCDVLCFILSHLCFYLLILDLLLVCLAASFILG